MNKSVIIKVFLLVAALNLVFIFGCKKEEEENSKHSPTLNLYGVIASESLSTTTGSTVMFSWRAQKKNAPLVSISIKKDDEFIQYWNEASIPASQSDLYIDSLAITMPNTPGTYTYKLIVTDSDDNSASKSVVITVTEPLVKDVFVYYPNSEFIFAIKTGTSSVNTSLMTWNVTNYNSETKVATISNTIVPNLTNVAVPSQFYFRKVSSGAMEYSSNGSSWMNLTDPNGSVNFMFVTKAAKPSSLWGSVSNLIKHSYYVDYPGGSDEGYRVESKYNSSSSDSYWFTEYSYECFSTYVGMTSSETYTSDHSWYPPFTYKREIDLVSYKIYMPDGTIREGGATKPNAPTNLNATYKKNQSIWNSNTGQYENRSYVWLTWNDNSNNEIKFNVYIKATDNNYYPLSLISNLNLSPDYFPSNSFNGTIKNGYYVNWPVGTYTFKIKAISATDESEFSNEAQVTTW